MAGAIGTAVGVELTSFSSDFFLTQLLPIIIFEAGFSSDKRTFFRNIGTIASLAVIGTFLSTMFIGYGLYALQQTGVIYVGETALDPLLFAALISAIDPVATLALYSHLQVDRTLYALVFGESIMNDAVAITMFDIFNGFSAGAVFGAKELFSAIGIFLLDFVGSLGIGVVLSMAVAWGTKHSAIESRPLSIVAFLCTGYVVYTLCEGAQLSGVLGAFFSAITLKHYAFYNITDDARKSIVVVLKTASFLAETIIYILLGVSFFDADADWDWAFISLATLLCLIGRLVNVFAIMAIANRFRRHPVPYKFQIMQWHSGLRGAIAFALAALLDEERIERREMFVTTTLLIVVLTTTVIGVSTPFLLRWLGIKTGDVETAEEHQQERQRLGTVKGTSLHGRWIRLDRNVLHRFLSNKFAAATDNTGLPLARVPASATSSAEEAAGGVTPQSTHCADGSALAAATVDAAVVSAGRDVGDGSEDDSGDEEGEETYRALPTGGQRGVRWRGRGTRRFEELGSPSSSESDDDASEEPPVRFRLVSPTPPTLPADDTAASLRLPLLSDTAGSRSLRNTPAQSP